MEKMLKVVDVQKHLGLSKNKAYALIQSKGFPKIIIGHRYFIPADQYEKYLKENINNKIIL
jgi:hypothetical protein